MKIISMGFTILFFLVSAADAYANNVRINAANEARLLPISLLNDYGLEGACFQQERENRIAFGIRSENRFLHSPRKRISQAMLDSGVPRAALRDQMKAVMQTGHQMCRDMADTRISNRSIAIPNFNHLKLQGACYLRARNDRMMLGIQDGDRFRPRAQQILRRAIRQARVAPRQRAQVLRQLIRPARRACNDLLGTAQTAVLKSPSSKPTTGKKPANDNKGGSGNNNSGGNSGGGGNQQPKTPQFPMPPIPERALWEANMASFGQTRCNQLASGNLSWDAKLDAVYYDGQWVFLQIKDYLGSNAGYWQNCANVARTIYRDDYVFPANGVVQGFRNFTHGLVLDYLQTGNSSSRTAAVMCSENGAFASDGTPLAATQHVNLSREVAYAVQSYLNAEKAGEPERERLTQLVNQIYGHFDQWFISKNAPFIRPFMVALSSHALIMYHDKTGDPDVIPTLTLAADWMWDNMWLPHAEAFQYTNINLGSGGTEPAPDLNMLIAPMYAWLYKQTGETRFQERGDQIFAGGVKQAWLGNGKQFNQSFRWSFDYVKWRSGQ